MHQAALPSTPIRQTTSESSRLRNRHISPRDPELHAMEKQVERIAICGAEYRAVLSEMMRVHELELSSERSHREALQEELLQTRAELLTMDAELTVRTEQNGRLNTQLRQLREELQNLSHTLDHTEGDPLPAEVAELAQLRVLVAALQEELEYHREMQHRERLGSPIQPADLEVSGVGSSQMVAELSVLRADVQRLLETCRPREPQEPSPKPRPIATTPSSEAEGRLRAELQEQVLQAQRARQELEAHLQDCRRALAESFGDAGPPPSPAPTPALEVPGVCLAPISPSAADAMVQENMELRRRLAAAEADVAALRAALAAESATADAARQALEQLATEKADLMLG
eukprot:EG_transcript_15699